jgi:hypothetical protein
MVRLQVAIIAEGLRVVVKKQVIEEQVEAP